MAYVLVDSDTFGFRDGDLGHVCDMGSAPSAGQLDIICINSDTIVQAAPSGFSLAISAVANQGSYIYYRFGTGGSTFTIDTAGDHNTLASWSRWGGAETFDHAEQTQANAAGANLTPAHSTGAFAETGELLIAFAALHGGLGVALNPVWSVGFTQFSAADYWPSVGERVDALVAYHLNAGTAAEAPQVTWETNNFVDRYMLTASFTAGDSDPQVAARFLPFF